MSEADIKRSSVSGPIQSVKMYSCAQCTIQEKSVCCRDVPCLAHMEQGPGPLHPRHLPPSLSARVMGTQSTSSLQQDGPGQWSGHLQAAQPRTCGSGKCMLDIVLYFRPVILSFRMLIK
jgi:hypothetical protein